MKYTAGQRSSNRRVTPAAWAALFVGLFLVGVVGYALVDLWRNQTAVDNSNNEAILGEFQGTQPDFVRVHGETYSIEIPEDWAQVNSPELLINRQRYYPDRFTGVAREDIGKRLDVYVGESLPDIAFDRALPIDVLGGAILPGSISPRCLDFTESVGNLDGIESRTQYDGTEFLCTMNTVTNVIGAIQTTATQGVYIEGDRTAERYLFVYQDHSSRIDNSLFIRILETFQAK